MLAQVQAYPTVATLLLSLYILIIVISTLMLTIGVLSGLNIKV